MYETRLVIRINSNGVTFVDLYKGSCKLPEYSAICTNQKDVDSALKSVDLLSSHDYTTELKFI